MTGCCAVLSAAMLLMPAAARNRINLVDFGQVVKFTGGGRPQSQPIERGPDGWEPWLAESGQYMIGVEWEQPRDLAEVNIEFRHAIANREKIEVQYYKEAAGQKDGSRGEGKWVTAKIAEWWAGDRDVSFTFQPASKDEGGNGSDVTYRRTRRLRFVLGKADLPPVRYIRAYGPTPATEGVFTIRLDANSKLRSPVDVNVTNGFVVEKGAGSATQSAQVSTPATLTIRLAKSDVASPDRTIVRLSNGANAEVSAEFIPAQVMKDGRVTLNGGVSVEYAAGASRPVATKSSGSQ